MIIKVNTAIRYESTRPSNDIYVIGEDDGRKYGIEGEFFPYAKNEDEKQAKSHRCDNVYRSPWTIVRLLERGKILIIPSPLKFEEEQRELINR